MTLLDEAEHVASPGNVAALMEIIDGQRLYIEALHENLNCYKAQAKYADK